jgi:hypothetical protein
MRMVNARIDHADGDVRAGLQVPCFGRVDIRIDLALPLAVEPAKLAEARIIGKRLRH